MKQTVKLVTFGDSITQGYLATAEEKRYVNLLTDKLNAYYENLHFELINRGVSGNKAYQGLERIHEVTSENPDLVTIMFGTNDCRYQFEVDKYLQDIRSIVDMIQDNNPNASIILGQVPFMTAFRDGNPELLAAYNKSLEEFALRKGIPLAKTYECFQGDPNLLDPDGFHPNNPGHEALAEAFYCVIIQNLKSITVS